MLEPAPDALPGAAALTRASALHPPISPATLTAPPRTVVSAAYTAYNGYMPHILPTTPHPTFRRLATHTANPSPTAASDTGLGILHPAPTYNDAVWYRQPWTVPVGGLLGFYCLFSLGILALLVLTGRLTKRGNTSARRAFEQRLDLWGVDPTVEEERRERYARGRSGRVRRAAYGLPMSDEGQGITIPRHRSSGTTSVAETEINYDDDGSDQEVVSQAMVAQHRSLSLRALETGSPSHSDPRLSYREFLQVLAAEWGVDVTPEHLRGVQAQTVLHSGFESDWWDAERARLRQG